MKSSNSSLWCSHICTSAILLSLCRPQRKCATSLSSKPGKLIAWKVRHTFSTCWKKNNKKRLTNRVIVVYCGGTSPFIALTRRFRSYGCRAMRVVSFTLIQATQTRQWEGKAQHWIKRETLGDRTSESNLKRLLTNQTVKRVRLSFFPCIWTTFSHCLAQLHQKVCQVLIRLSHFSNGFPCHQNAEKIHKISQ